MRIWGRWDLQLSGRKKGLPEALGQAEMLCFSVALVRRVHPGHRDRVCHGLHWVLAQDADLRVWGLQVFLPEQVLQVLVQVLVLGLDVGHRVSGQDLALGRVLCVAEAVVVFCDVAEVVAADDGRRSRLAVYRRSKGLSLQARTAREETCVFP